MIKLSNYIKKENIIMLGSGNKKDVIDEMFRKAFDEKDQDLIGRITNNILKERSVSRGIKLGNDYFISHTRTNEIDEMMFKIGICRNKVEFDRKIFFKVIILILIPDSLSKTYLSFLAHFARFLKRDGVDEAFNNENIELIIKLTNDFDIEFNTV